MATWAKGVDFKNSDNTKNIGGIGVYGNDTTPEKLYIGLGTEPWNNAGLQLTDNEINFKGNKIYHAGNKPSLNELGAANASHNHTSLSSVTKISGAGASGHWGSIDIGGSKADWAGFNFSDMGHSFLVNKKGYSGIWTNTGNTVFAFNENGALMTGSVGWDKITGKPSTFAPTSHTHDYLPLSGGSMTGNLILRLSGGTLSGAGITTGNTQIIGTAADTIYFGNPKTKIVLESISNPEVHVNGTTYTMYHTGNKPKHSDIGAAAASHTHNYAASNSAGGGALEIIPVQDTSNKIYLAGVLDFNSAKIRASTPYLAGGTITATTFSGALNGNASTATKLKTAKTITIGNANRSFDGSNNIAWTLGDIGAAEASHNHTSLTGVNSIAFASDSTDSVSMGVLVDGTKSYMDFNLADDFDDMWRWRFKASGSSIFNAMTLQALSSTTSRLTVAGEVAATTFSGNATTATKLQTPKAIKIGNSSKNFDGSGNVTWTLNEIGASASNHTHSNYLQTSGGTLSGAVKFSTATIGASPNSNTLQVSGTNDSGMGGIKLGAGGCRIYGKKDAAILFVEGGIFTNDTLQTSDAVIPGAYRNANSDTTNGWARIVRGYNDNVGSIKVQVGGTNTTASFEVVNPNWSTAWFSCGNTGIRSNSYSNFSDRTLKTNIEEIKKISNKMNKIGVYTYNYLSDFDTDISTCSGEARLCENMPDKRWGVIAQEVEELFPELITESKTLINGENKVVKSVDVYGLTVLTLEFAKEIYKENQMLKTEINLIKEKLGL